MVEVKKEEERLRRVRKSAMTAGIRSSSGTSPNTSPDLTSPKIGPGYLLSDSAGYQVLAVVLANARVCWMHVARNPRQC
eukprot:2745204-Rhodomonas_salina.3